MICKQSKIKVTRVSHICYKCGKVIPPKTRCYWYKAVAFKDSDIGRNIIEEKYICAECAEI